MDLIKTRLQINQSFRAVCFFLFALGFTGCQNIRNFSFSPDGQEIVLGIGSDAGGNNGGIYVAGKDTRGVRRLTFPAGRKEEDYDPVYSSDGSKIAFCRRDMKELWSWSHLHIMNSEGQIFSS